MRRILFLDRDGTILEEPEVDKQVDSIEKFAFISGAISTLKKIASTLEFDLVMVTNQDGLGTDSFPREAFQPLQELMIRILEGEGVRFRAVHIDDSFPHQGLSTRKPGTALVDAYRTMEVDLQNSWVIGDRMTDIQFAKNLGTRAILLGKERGEGYLTASNWDEVYSLLEGTDRTATLLRKTSETAIEITLNLDRSAPVEIGTGLGFFDHMLTQIAKHGDLSLLLATKGDLHIDEHHTVEDTGIALGEALRSALGRKKGITRFASCVPMDESLARVSLDLSGRSYLSWDVPLGRERIGDVPCEMFRHFFESVAHNLQATLHIEARGENEHHIIESVFKGFGRCFREAKMKTTTGIPSSKGAL